MEMKRALIVLVILSLSISLAYSAGPVERGAKKMAIASIMFQEDSYFRALGIGMKEAADKAGVELLSGNCYNKLDKEMELVNTYISRGVDAIILSPLSQTASVQALKQANEKGIKIILYNTGVDADFYSTLIESSHEVLGQSTGKVARKYIQEKLGGKAKIGIIDFVALLPEQSNARSDGFLSQLKDLPGVEVVASQSAWLAEAATQVAGDVITANPSINVIYACNDGGTVGATMAVKNAGKAGKIVVFGIDGNEQLANFMLSPDNILQATTAQQPYAIGAKTIEMAIKAIKGETMEKHLIVPGILLDRANPDGLKVFLKDMEALTK
jgi:simple sugar transport system substrate-binding protein/ribose transport system substrate-binding protein